MSLRLEIKRKETTISQKVKSVDLHPTETWILASLFSGTVSIWNYQTKTTVKSFKVSELPVRSAKFIARKQWVVAGTDDMLIRVYNYITKGHVRSFDAHTDRIRCVAVHPTLPYVLSSSDDSDIKLWDWGAHWQCKQRFKGHNDFVMQVTFNPKDTQTFASASLDCKVKIWNLSSPHPNFTLDAHSKGLNCVDYFTGGDKPYLITGSDDHTAKVWDYETKICIKILKGHTKNVSAVCFHPELPIIMTGSEDGTVRIWHATTYCHENTLNYGLGSVWAFGYMKGSRRAVIGYNEGTIMIRIGSEEPVASMDNRGNMIWAKHNEVQTVNIKSVGADYEVTDGERLPLAVQELGPRDIFPQSLKHNPNGRFVAVCGDGKCTVYEAKTWRNMSVNSALEFVWSIDGEFAVRESTTKIKVFSKTIKEKNTIRPTFSAERIYGGILLAMCSNDFICFYDWAECRLIWRIDVSVKNVYWADSYDLVAIASDASFDILKYNGDVVSQHLDSGRAVDEQGIEGALKVLYKINERVRTGLWVDECFIYNNSSWCLNYCIGGEVLAMFDLDRPLYFLGYLANQNRVYLIDKEFNVVGYALVLSLIKYKTLMMHGEVEQASEILPYIPKEHRKRLSFCRLKLKFKSLQYQRPASKKPTNFYTEEEKSVKKDDLTICGPVEGPSHIKRTRLRTYLDTPPIGGTFAEWLNHHVGNRFCKFHALLGEIRPMEGLRRVIAGMMRAVCVLHMNGEYHGRLRDANNYFFSANTDYLGRGHPHTVEVTLLNRKTIHREEGTRNLRVKKNKKKFMFDLQRTKKILFDLQQKDRQDLCDLIFVDSLHFDADGIIETVNEEILGGCAKGNTNLKVPLDLKSLRDDFLNISVDILYLHPAIRHHDQRFEYYSDILSEVQDFTKEKRKIIKGILDKMSCVPQWKTQVVDERLKKVLNYPGAFYKDHDSYSLLRFLKAVCLHLNQHGNSLSHAEIDKLLRDTFPSFVAESYKELSTHGIYC